MEKITSQETEKLFDILKTRFEKHQQRHPGINWTDVVKRLEKNPLKIQALHRMEASGGEPDVVGIDTRSGEFLFFDCSEESPKGRRSICFDRAALDARKLNKPAGCASEMAADIGIEILTEEDYRSLQQLGRFDLKTSNWIQTPESIRNRGGALFCDRRYDTVFTYHNDADSYYAARGFRGKLTV